MFGELVNFAKNNPQLSIDVRQRSNHHPVVIAHFHLQRAIASDPQDTRWVTGIANAHDELVTLWRGCTLRAERFNKQLPAASAAT
jgi:hypothetical protein